MSDWWTENSHILSHLKTFIDEVTHATERKAEEKFTGRISSLEEERRQLLWQIEDLKRTLSIKNTSIENLSKAYARAVKVEAESYPSIRPNNYFEVVPGAITHEDVLRKFTSFFTKYRREYSSHIVTWEQKGYSLPCFLLKIAYEKCKINLLCFLTSIILQKPMDRSLQRVTKEIVDHAQRMRSDQVTFMDTRLIVMEELKDIFNEPKNDEEILYWEGKKATFFMLLKTMDGIKSPIPDEVEHQVLNQMLKVVGVDSNSEFKGIINEAVSLAYSMVTLVPPAIISHPTEYNEDLVEPRTNYWIGGKSVTLYFRPIMFFSANGFRVSGVGAKGEIGNEKYLTKDVVYTSHERLDDQSRRTSKHSAVGKVHGTNSTPKYQTPPFSQETRNAET